MATYRQIQAVKNIAENRGSLRENLKNAGYSQSTADNPKRLTQSKGFRQLLDDILPEEKVTQEIRNLLYSSKVEHYVFPSSMSDEEIQDIVESIPGCKLKKIKHSDTMSFAYYWIPDNRSKKDALDMILKVRGHFAPQKVQMVDNYDQMSSDELDSKITELQERVQAKKVDTSPQLPTTGNQSNQ